MKAAYCLVQILIATIKVIKLQKVRRICKDNKTHIIHNWLKSHRLLQHYHRQPHCNHLPPPPQCLHPSLASLVLR